LIIYIYIYTDTHTHTHTYIYIYIYSERENKIVLVSLSDGTTGDGRGKKMLENEKYWDNPSICEYNMTYCAISCQILGEHGDRESVSDGGLIWLEHDKYRPEVPRWNTLGPLIYI
jgi:hypothetical protein